MTRPLSNGRFSGLEGSLQPATIEPASMSFQPPLLPSNDAAAVRLIAQRGGALCTIVHIDDSFSRRVGAQLAIAPDGTMVGSLADGCLESELARQARIAAASDNPVLLRYGAGSPFVDFRLPCGAGIDIFVDPAPCVEQARETVALLDRRSPAQWPLPAQAAPHARGIAFLPALSLLSFGAGPEQDRLIHLARSAGIDARMVKPGPGGLSLGRPPMDRNVDAWTAIVVLFHDHEWESALLPWALGTDAFFVGAIGGRLTRERRIAMLRRAGVEADRIARLRAPVGLIPHTRDPDTMALSILADVVGRYDALVDDAPDQRAVDNSASRVATSVL